MSHTRAMLADSLILWDAWIRLVLACLMDSWSDSDLGNLNGRSTLWGLCHVPLTISEQFSWCRQYHWMGDALVLRLQWGLGGRWLWSGVHMKSRTDGLAAGHCILMRWIMVFTCSVSGHCFSVMAYWCVFSISYYKFSFPFGHCKHFKIPASHLSSPPPYPTLSLSSASHAAPCWTSTPNAAEGPSRPCGNPTQVWVWPRGDRT